MNDNEMKLSDQALGAIMMALQKCILEGVDVTDVLRNLRIKNSEVGLVVMNPPLVKFSNEEEAVFSSDDA